VRADDLAQRGLQQVGGGVVGLGGVAGTPVRLVIIRGPSASSTTAIAYGASPEKPGAGR